MIGKTILHYRILEKLGEPALPDKKGIIEMNDLVGQIILHYKILEQVGQAEWE